jgi:hypothetical protein
MLFGLITAYLLVFFTLMISHVGKNETLSEKIRYDVSLDELYQLIPRLALFDFYFLRYGPITGTM